MALDEAHEMCINKDMKAAVTHPTHTYLQKTSPFFNYHIKAFKTLIQVLFPEKSEKFMYNNTITDDAPYAKHSEENIQKMCSKIDANKLVSIQEENRGLMNVFSGQVATPEQTVDMLRIFQRHSITGIQTVCQYQNNTKAKSSKRSTSTSEAVNNVYYKSQKEENDTKRARS